MSYHYLAQPKFLNLFCCYQSENMVSNGAVKIQKHLYKSIQKHKCKSTNNTNKYKSIYTEQDNT